MSYVMLLAAIWQVMTVSSTRILSAGGNHNYPELDNWLGYKSYNGYSMGIPFVRRLNSDTLESNVEDSSEEQKMPELFTPQNVNVTYSNLYEYASNNCSGGVTINKRTHMAGNDLLEYYDGPIYTNYSEAQCIAGVENKAYDMSQNGLTQDAVSFSEVVPKKNVSYESFYETFKVVKDIPSSSNISDEAFGKQRTSIKGFNLEEIKTDSDIKIISSIKGKFNTSTYCKGNYSDNSDVSYYVSDFSMMEEYQRKPLNYTKYVPSLKAYYCYGPVSKKLMPVGVWIKSTDVVYTPSNTLNDWILAKISVNVAENTWQQFTHLISTHAFALPFRIAAKMHLVSRHPVREYVMYHTFSEFNTDYMAKTILLRNGGVLDEIHGLGVYGSVKLMDHYAKTTYLFNTDFNEDIKYRNISKIDNNPYVIYGSKYYKSINAFASDYVNIYYDKDSDVLNDRQLQNWYVEATKVKQLRGMRTSLNSKEYLSHLLTEICFRSTFKHHSMNGDSVWHANSMPYSPNKLIKKLPEKPTPMGQIIDFSKYIPKEHEFPKFMFMVTSFCRPVNKMSNMLNAYATFKGNGKKLDNAIDIFNAQMAAIQADMLYNVHNNDDVSRLRPSMLPIVGVI